ncbi:MAG: glycoside hydrolase family 127 protein, partial [bacterium]
FSLFLRVPGGVEGMAEVKVRGMKCAEGGHPGSYFEVRHHWREGDTVELRLPMPARKIPGHPLVESTRGCVALARGPLVYCVEGADHPGR